MSHAEDHGHIRGNLMIRQIKNGDDPPGIGNHRRFCFSTNGSTRFAGLHGGTAGAGVKPASVFPCEITHNTQHEGAEGGAFNRDLTDFRTVVLSNSSIRTTELLSGREG